MFAEENCFHSDPVQVLNSTSGNPSPVETGMYIPQRLLAPKRGTGLENSTRLSSISASELVLVSVFLLSLFLTGCSPSMHQTELGPPEVPPVVVISGTSTISGDLVTDSTVDPGGASTASTGSDSATQASDAQASARDRLVVYSQAASVQERTRRVMGWLEFGRSQVALARLNSGAARVAANKLAHSESELRELFSQNQELTLWRELLVDPEFDATLSAEDLSALKQRLEKAAFLLASAEKPEDVQELDRVLTIY